MTAEKHVPQTCKVFIHAFISEGRFHGFSAHGFKMEEPPDNNGGGFFVFVKEVEVDCTPPEGWDYRMEGAKILKEGLKKFNERVAKTRALFEDQMSKLMAIGYSKDGDIDA